MWDGSGSQPVHGRAAAALWAADGLRTRPTAGVALADEDAALELHHIVIAGFIVFE